MLESIAISLLTGVISGFCASWLFLSHTKRKLPEIVVSDDMITDADPETNQCSLAVKFVNKSPNSLVNLTVYVFGSVYQNDDKSMVHYHKISEKQIPFVAKFDKTDTQAHYAVTATLPIEESLDGLTQKYDDVTVKIIGLEAFYGTYVTLSKSYALSEVKKGYIFEFGDNVSARKLPKTTNTTSFIETASQ